MNIMNNENCKTELKPTKWYSHPEFPLIPEFSFKKGNEYNTNHYYFHWLVFSFWTLNAPDFEISLVISDHWGIGIIGVLPYLRWRITIPCPNKVQIWMMNNLWRKP